MKKVSRLRFPGICSSRGVVEGALEKAGLSGRVRLGGEPGNYVVVGTQGLAFAGADTEACRAAMEGLAAQERESGLALTKEIKIRGIIDNINARVERWNRFPDGNRRREPERRASYAKRVGELERLLGTRARTTAPATT